MHGISRLRAVRLLKQVVKRRLAESAHASEIDFQDLAALSSEEHVVSGDGLFVYELLELIGFSELVAFGVGAGDAHLIYHNAVVVNLAELIVLLQVVPADFVVVRDVVATAQARDAHKNV